jgi:hypothetical protein
MEEGKKSKRTLPRTAEGKGVSSSLGCIPREVVLAKTSPVTSPEATCSNLIGTHLLDYESIAVNRKSQKKKLKTSLMSHPSVYLRKSCGLGAFQFAHEILCPFQTPVCDNDFCTPE